MNDRGKVIYSIERCICHVPDACRDCGYDNEPCPKCFEHLLRDALSLLKAQEPIPCGEKIKAGDVVLDFYECGYCKNAIRKPWRYCPFCGKEVKWDD